MTTYGWLLFLHITGAFCYFGGALAAVVLSVATGTRERPSEVAALMRLTRVAVIVLGVGIVMTIVFGLWLVHEAGYSYGEGWIVASLVLWAVAGALGAAGGRREGATHKLAKRLATGGDAPSAELRSRLRDPATLALSYGALVALLAILVLMIWKPGAN